ncbi:MAG TPA: class I SAM-dependent methyltransferase [Thermomicrobiales bacterium]
MSDPYTVIAPYYDRQGLGQWSKALIAFTLDTLLPRYGRRPRTALDLACGTGNAVVTLAARGLDVVGLDRSAPMLTIARAKAARAGVRCGFVRADLRAFAFARPFDLITCAYDSLNYLTEPQELRTAFEQIRAALAPQGLLVCDLTTARAYADEPREPQTFDLGDIAYSWTTAWDSAQQRATTTLGITMRVGERMETLTEAHPQRPYSCAEVEGTLRVAGLRPLRMFATRSFLTPTLDPPTPDTARIIYVAEPTLPTEIHA